MMPTKDVKIGIKPNTILYGINFTSGGTLPKELSGTFTSETLAQRAVNIWNSNRRGNKTSAVVKD